MALCAGSFGRPLEPAVCGNALRMLFSPLFRGKWALGGMAGGQSTWIELLPALWRWREIWEGVHWRPENSHRLGWLPRSASFPVPLLSGICSAEAAQSSQGLFEGMALSMGIYFSVLMEGWVHHRHLGLQFLSFFFNKLLANIGTFFLVKKKLLEILLTVVHNIALPEMRQQN